MMLLDSNIVIYAAQSGYDELRRWIAGLRPAPAISAIRYVEVLGYHKLTEAERTMLEGSFASAMVLPIGDEVLTKAVRLRQTRKMSLGDALVAATALVHGRTLVTRNVRDFEWIPGLSVFNPLAST
jgi:predicted nucleic acid-binding protein